MKNRAIEEVVLGKKPSKTRSNSATGSSMIKLLLSCIILTGFTLNLGWGQEISLPSNPLKGRYVLEEKGCTNCHTIKGVGGETGPDLAELDFHGSYLEISSSLWNHLPEMLHRSNELGLSFPEFTNAEISELVTFLYYLRYLGEPGNIRRGKALVKEKNCLACHRVAGKGGDVGPSFDRLSKYISPIYLAQALWNHEPKMEAELQKKKLAQISFTGSDIEDISSFIRATSKGPSTDKIYMSPGNPKRGQAVFENKGCLDCHNLYGKGQDIGPDLLSLGWDYSVSDIAGKMWNHSASMHLSMKSMSVEWPNFSGNEMADLIAYLYFIDFKDLPGDAANGRTTLREKGCITCHDSEHSQTGSENSFSNLGSKFTDVDLARIMWNHAPIMESRMSEKVIPWPKLSGKELSDILAYLHNLD